MMMQQLTRTWLAVATVVVALCVPTKVEAIRQLRIASPLQSLTIWDAKLKEELVEPSTRTFRNRFLPRFRAGLEAETAARKRVSERRNQRLAALNNDSGAGGGSGSNKMNSKNNKHWAAQAAATDGILRANEARFVENAYDEALKQLDEFESQERSKARKASRSSKKQDRNKYQFVGVINPKSDQAPISWYARKKPSHSKWSVRLVHVNRDAVIKDLFHRGKVDLFAKYDNTGKTDPESKQPVVTAQYTVRERSWKNLWNFSPVHYFTDSSGMYWRERRLRPGLYTDGNAVYESSYRYQDGRNGMHRRSSLDQYLASPSIDAKHKDRIRQRLREDSPDVVLEG